VIDGNTKAMARFPEILPADRVKRLTDRLIALTRAHAALLDARGRTGQIRHGHGDLHLGNIALVDGRPLLFDCLEFDADLATGDVLYDLSFLLMDLCVHGRRHAANLVFNRYFDRCADDEEGLSLCLCSSRSEPACAPMSWLQGQRGSQAISDPGKRPLAIWLTQIG
jgi:aminoglycoside phosphotransferase family enzyme